MSPRVVSSALLLGAAFLACPASAADATKEQCIAANDHAQELRQAGKLGKAREQLLVCVAQSCPGPVREDCAQRLDELDKATPTIVFEIKDASGNDVTAATVKVDGQPFTQVGGAAAPVDPGEHHFVFEATGSSTEKVIMIREAEKARRVQIVLEVAPPRAQPGLATGTESPPDGSTQRTLGLVVGGAGVAGIVLGGVFGLVSKATYNNALQNECGNNPGNCSTQGAQDGQSAQSQATISTVGFVAGAVLLAGGAVLFFTAPKAGRVGIAPTVGTGAAALNVVGAW